ncbi:MAG: disulfide bond formation protein B [Rhizobiales bacterium PAR1]|nr:MAG: disulfide bond formation protein B [Rhizobiales bacterium PAR1]
MPGILVTIRGKLTLVLLLALSAISGAWFSELVLGFVPCMLCLWERWPYYIALPIALVGLALLRGGRARHLPQLAGMLGVIFLASMALGAYHAGVEWKWFPAPDCGGRLGGAAPSLDDFRKSLNTARVVLCNEAPMRILGLSFAGWNAVASAVIAALCFSAARQKA